MVFNSIDWTAIDVVINLFNTLIIFIPALVSFVYYKTHKIDIYITSQTNSGIKLYLHNVSKNTVFILDAIIKSKELENDVSVINSFETQENSETKCILPDSMICLTLDYAMLNITPIKKGKLILCVGNRRIVKKIK